jgi:hypothetical protein
MTSDGGEPLPSVRQFVHEAVGKEHHPYASLAEARTHPEAAVVLFGDFGGTIYLTAPMRHVACSETVLSTLLSDLDAITWMGGAEYGASVAFERHAIGEAVLGGDGGGAVIDGVWMHPRFDAGIAELSRDVVAGRRERLPGGLLRSRRAENVDARRHRREKYREENERRGIPWDFDILDPVVPFPEDAG